MWLGQDLGVRRWGTGDSGSGEEECKSNETSNLDCVLPGLGRAGQLSLRRAWGEMGAAMEGGVGGIGLGGGGEVSRCSLRHLASLAQMG